MGMGSLLRMPFFRMREHRNEAVPAIPGIDYRKAVAALEEAGFWVLREDAHVVMTNGTRILTVPCQDLVNALTLEGIVRDASLSPEEFRRLL